jgi:sugar phosphate isomerase/epimerase
LPFRLRDRYLPFILEQRLQPEVAFLAEDFSHPINESLQHLARELSRVGLSATVHAPFMDLNPGALDPLVREVTLSRYHQTLDAASILGAKLVVFHPGYDRWRYAGQSRLWIDQSLKFWPPLLKRAEHQQIRMTLENIFEEEPFSLAALVSEIDSDWLGHCFDIGHWHLFSQTPINEWLTALGPRLFHLHLHDNHGKYDAHLPIGDGDIDFPLLFSWLSSHQVKPSMTLEAHSPELLLRSKAAAAKLLIAGNSKGQP